MATKNLGGRGKGTALNLALAGLAAAGVGFAMFAMPDALFGELVARSRLADYFAAAQPPLGMKARGAAVAAGVILVFAAVVLLLGALDRVSRRPKRKPVAAPNFDMPKTRRADAHPDAPARAPLLAGSELGEPFEEDAFLAGMALDEPFEEEEAAVGYEPEKPFEEAEVAAGYAPEENFEAEPAREMFADLEARPLPGFLAVDQSALIESEAEEQAEDEPLLLDQPADDDSIDALVAQLPELPEMTGGESIGDLMRRLETGLSRCEIGEQSEPVEAQAEAEVEAEAEVQTETWREPEPEHTVEPEAQPWQPGPETASEPGAQPWQPEPETASEPIAEEVEAEAEVQPWQQPEPVAEAVAPWQPEPVAEAAAPEPVAEDIAAEPQPVWEAPPVEAAQVPPTPITQPAEPHVGHRLRAAIEEMQKVAARG